MRVLRLIMFSSILLTKSTSDRLNDLCTFEQDFCTWTAVGSSAGVRWRRHTGATPSYTYSTGPQMDHTTENTTTHNGSYIYMETSLSAGVYPGDMTQLESVEMASSSDQCKVTFWYHMFGSDIRSLRVRVRNILKDDGDSTMWTKTGQIGNVWQLAEVVITPEPNTLVYKIVIEAQAGATTGDIALDDVTISTGCLEFQAQPPARTIRLTDGGASYQGRVELKTNGQWGTICDDSFNNDEALVVCKQLGFVGFISYHHNSFYGPGSGPIYLDDLKCNGNETEIQSCSHRGVGVHNCDVTHKEDIGVECDRSKGNSQLRLISGDGGSPRMGRLQIERNGTWGSVCDEGMTLREAGVICYQLGYSDGAAEIRQFGRTPADSENQPIWFGNVRCLGTEATLDSCIHPGWQNHTCTSHTKDIGVVCSCSSNCQTEGALRLAQGTTSTEGILEIYHNHQWGTVCDDGWDVNDAEVACRQLGFIGVNTPQIIGHNLNSLQTKIWLQNVQCNGQEANLTDCYRPKDWTAACSQNENIAISCLIGLPIDDVRLVSQSGIDTTALGEGIIQGKLNSKWSYVCYSSWFSRQDRRLDVVCQQLGFRYYAGATDYFASSITSFAKIYTTAICQGTENSLHDCANHQWFKVTPGVWPCYASERALKCTDIEPTTLRMTSSGLSTIISAITTGFQPITITRFSNDPPQEVYDKGGLSVGAATGITVSVLVFLAIIIGLAIYKKKTGKGNNRPDMYRRRGQPETPSFMQESLHSDGIYMQTPPPSYTEATFNTGFDNMGYTHSPAEIDAGVREFLDCLGLLEYSAAFARERITTNTLFELNEKNLESLGVRMGDRKRIMNKLSMSTPYAQIEDNQRVRYQVLRPQEQRHDGGVYTDLTTMVQPNESLKPNDCSYTQYDSLQKSSIANHVGPLHSNGENLYTSMVVSLPPDPRLGVYEEPLQHQNHSSDVHYQAPPSGSPYNNATGRTEVNSCGVAAAENIVLSVASSHTSLSSTCTLTGLTGPNVDSSTVPPEFYCPLSHQFMTDPVQASDGRTYERQAIENWLNENKVSPIGRQPMDNYLTEDRKIRKKLRKWKKNQTQSTSQSGRVSFINVD